MDRSSKARAGQALSAESSLDMQANFDVYEEVAIGTTAHDFREGDVQGTDSDFGWPTDRSLYMWRSMYNGSNTDRTIKYEIEGYTKNFSAYVPKGTWFHLRGPLKTIPTSGTDSCTMLFAGNHKGIANGTGAHRIA